MLMTMAVMTKVTQQENKRNVADNGCYDQGHSTRQLRGISLSCMCRNVVTMVVMTKVSHQDVGHQTEKKWASKWYSKDQLDLVRQGKVASSDWFIRQPCDI